MFYSKSCNLHKFVFFSFLFQGATIRKKVDEKKDDEIGAWNKSSFVQEKKLARNMFPITTNIFFLSLLFWTVISIFIYYSFSYGLLYSRITQEMDLTDHCVEVFSTAKDDNLKKVSLKLCVDFICSLF